MNEPAYMIYQILDFLLKALSIAIIARAVISWIRPNPWHPVVRFLVKVTEPILGPLGRIIPPIAGLDFTPIIALLLISVVQNLLPRLLLGY